MVCSHCVKALQALGRTLGFTKGMTAVGVFHETRGAPCPGRSGRGMPEAAG